MAHFNLLLDSQLAKQNNAYSRSHDFTINYDPPIALSPSKTYKAALNELVSMSYSWYNIAKRYKNNEFKWRKKTENWKTVTIPDGMYDYKSLNTTIQALIGRVDPSKRTPSLFSSCIFTPQRIGRSFCCRTATSLT